MSTNNIWWRGGDPSSLWTILYEGDAGLTVTEKQMKKDVTDLRLTLDSVTEAKRRGYVTDAYVGYKGGRVSREDIGGNPVTHSLAQYFREHYTTIAGQIVGRTATPSWMYPELRQDGEGLNSNRSDHIDALCMGAAQERNARKEALARDLLVDFLLVTGSARFVSRFVVTSRYANIRDRKLWEETRQAREAANRAALENAEMMVAQGIADEEGRLDYLRRAEVIADEQGTAN